MHNTFEPTVKQRRNAVKHLTHETTFLLNFKLSTVTCNDSIISLFESSNPMNPVVPVFVSRISVELDCTCEELTHY